MSFASIMRRFTRLALHLVPGFLVIGLVSFGGLCVAQEVEVDAPGGSGGSGSVVAPSAWLVLINTIRERVDLKLYGFYIGELEVPCVQLDVTTRVTNFLLVTPSYMYYDIPASGLNELAEVPVYTDSYDEHQFRIDGTLVFPVRRFEFSVRNMFVRRFRTAPTPDSNRYRGRVGFVYNLPVGAQTEQEPGIYRGRIWRLFATYEAYCDIHNGGWNKDRVWVGVTLPLLKRVSFQPSYMWEGSEGLKDVNYLLLGVIINTG